ncbi:hypothetical protein JCM10908_007294 [Rhodotorula pacifica]|uniref:uncharacterized protein n=1 Tax=Rhodotorula pacifica TaxID=1495444 RepID=UPI003181791E
MGMQLRINNPQPMSKNVKQSPINVHLHFSAALRPFVKKLESVKLIVSLVDGGVPLIPPLTATPLTPLPHNLRLSFPLAYAEKGAELWANAEFLTELSPFWRDLLASDFAEAEPVNPRKRVRRSETLQDIAADSGDSPDDGFEGSDVEAEQDEKAQEASEGEEEGRVGTPVPAQPGQTGPPVDFVHRQVTIKSTRFATYRAVLLYLQTGYIDFAAIGSTAKQRQEHVKAGLPARVSPRSVYRLAHLLRLEELQSHALDALWWRLTPTNPGSILFSSTSIAYPDLYKVVLQYVLQSWEKVHRTAEWTAITEQVADDEIPGAAAILVQVLRGVSKL